MKADAVKAHDAGLTGMLRWTCAVGDAVAVAGRAVCSERLNTLALSDLYGFVVHMKGLLAVVSAG